MKEERHWLQDATEEQLERMWAEEQAEEDRQEQEAIDNAEEDALIAYMIFFTRLMKL